ncbi:MAG: DUF4097 family beta strand repeat protein [Clostridia bacterium]|nr:DUF4097 family beta strand repeat protein [Clostridia bacterium]
MKKLFKFSAILLAVGIIIILIGFFIIRHNDVSSASVYSAIEENLKLSEDDYEYTEPQRTDLTSVRNRSNSKTAECGLNEFSGLELYGEKCSIQFFTSNGEKMTVALTSGTLVTASSNGKFYIQAVGSGSDSKLTVGVPDMYKGGVDLQMIECIADIGFLDSSMDMSLNVKDSTISAASLSADNVSIVSNGSAVKAEILSAVDTIDTMLISSDLKVNGTYAKTQSMITDHAKARLNNMEGRWTLKSNMSTIEASFQKMSSGMSIDLNAGSALICLPKNCVPDIDHSEKYGVLKNKLSRRRSAESEEAVRSLIDCNIRYGVVTLYNSVE